MKKRKRREPPSFAQRASARQAEQTENTENKEVKQKQNNKIGKALRQASSFAKATADRPDVVLRSLPRQEGGQAEKLYPQITQKVTDENKRKKGLNNHGILEIQGKGKGQYPQMTQRITDIVVDEYLVRNPETVENNKRIISCQAT